MTMPKGTDAPISVTLKGTSANGSLADSAQPINFKWSLYNSDGAPTFTQYSESSTISAASQNGRPAAQLVSVSLANSGQIVANYSNGAPQQVVGQLAVASIRNPESLLDAGNNNFTTSADTANPAIGAAGSGGRGTIQGSAREASTVDIASEFSSLLVYQRSYQADSKVVTVADQLSQDALNLIHA
jgi:flagellar hook protein FlgE